MKIFSVLLLFTLALWGCTPRVPVSVEIHAAEATSEWLVSRHGLCPDESINSLVNRVLSRLSATVYGTALERELMAESSRWYTDYPWQVIILNTHKPTAFSAGAGILIVSRGLLGFTGSEAELAAILAHEMSHNILGHTRSAIERTGFSTSRPRFSFSLQEEIDADSLSLRILKVARYDLRHAQSALSIAYRQLLSSGSTIPPQWLSLRMMNIHRGIQNAGPYLPATQTSREFVRIRNSLSR